MAVIPNQHNLEFKEHGAEQQKVFCPKCKDERRNKREKPLSVNIRTRVCKCHHCGWADRIDGWKPDDNYIKPISSGWSGFKEKVQLFMAGRGIGIDTIKANKIIQRVFPVNVDGQWQDQVFVGFPYFMVGEKGPVNVKWRCVEAKEFRQEKGAMHLMYNLPMWANAREVIICEGEMDVLSWNEAGVMEATTLSDGAINENDRSVEGKLQSLHNSWHWLKGKDRFYLCLDNDGPGRRLQEVLASRLDPSKCYIIKLPDGCKDPNDCLRQHGKEKLLECKAAARPVPVSGITYVQDIADQLLDNFVNGVKMGELTHMGDLDKIFRWKPSSINIWTGYMNTGKSTFFLQAALTKSILDGWRWCVFSPENWPAVDFFMDLIEMYVGKNVSDRFGNKMTLQEFEQAMDFINKHFVFVYPDEDHTIDTLHKHFEQVIGKHGIAGVLVDPYNQLERSFPGNRDDQEISEFMNRATRFTTKHNIIYNITVHPKRVTIKPGEPWPVVDENLLAGGAMWGNKAHHILSVYRPNAHTDRKDPVVRVHQFKVKRKRTGGEYGQVEFSFDIRSHRYAGTDGMVYCDPARKENYEASLAIQKANASAAGPPKPSRPPIDISQASLSIVHHLDPHATAPNDDDLPF